MIALAIAACDWGGDDANEARPATPELDAAQQFALDRGREDVEATRAALARGEIPTRLACASAQAYVHVLHEVATNRNVAELVADVDATCRHELPRAIANAEIAKAIKARAAHPTDPVLDECYSGSLDRALSDLAEAEHPEAQTLEEKYRQVCPTGKSVD